MSDKMYIPATLNEVLENQSLGKANGIKLVYTTLKNGKEISDFIADFVLKKNVALSDTIKSLKPGQKIKVQKEKNGQYYNTVAIYTDMDNKPSSSFKSSSSGGGNVDFNTRAARGQALNLAVTVSVAEGKHMDDSFILSQIDRFLKLGEQVQSGKSAPKKLEPKVEDSESELDAFFEE